jgi:hypothetical protein
MKAGITGADDLRAFLSESGSAGLEDTQADDLNDWNRGCDGSNVIGARRTRWMESGDQGKSCRFLT